MKLRELFIPCSFAIFVAIVSCFVISCDTLANFFASSSYYELLQPNIYVFADPAFFDVPENQKLRIVFHPDYCNTDFGSSGSPIINSFNYKVIGIHKGYKELRKINLGTLLKANTKI